VSTEPVGITIELSSVVTPSSRSGDGEPASSVTVSGVTVMIGAVVSMKNGKETKSRFPPRSVAVTNKKLEPSEIGDGTIFQSPEESTSTESISPSTKT
jgi:hypothetical protein